MISNNIRIALLSYFFLFSFSLFSQKGSTDSDFIKYQEPYDTLLFKDEKLEELTDIASRIQKLKDDQRFIFFYDQKWKPTSMEKAVYINTVKILGKDTFLVKDYFFSGERQSSGISISVIKDIDFSNFYSYSQRDIRKIGKTIYWKKIGRIDFISFCKWSNWENGYYSTDRINIDSFESPFSKNYKITNKSDLIIEELYNQVSDFDKIN